MKQNAERKAQGARLRAARIAAGFRSARDAALQNNWPESSYRAHETGTRTIGQDDAERYARRFKLAGVSITSQAILFESAGEAVSAPSYSVRVSGRIGAGAEINPDAEQVPPEGLAELEMDFPVRDGTIAFQVEGDSMWPAYFDGDVIICGQQIAGPEGVVGQEAAVQTLDGRRYLKRVLKGSLKGTFDLESHNAPPIRGVRLEWAAAVDMIVRRANHRLARRVAKRRA